MIEVDKIDMVCIIPFNMGVVGWFLMKRTGEVACKI